MPAFFSNFLPGAAICQSNSTSKEEELMQGNDDRYTRFGLVRDMLETPRIIGDFQCSQVAETAREIVAVGRLLMTGEGSSRIFPAKNAIAQARREGAGLQLHTDAGLQSQEYSLLDWAVFALSNSGRTAEVIGLFTKLREAGHQHCYSLTAFADSKLESLANRGFVLTCGAENAVAATKSVVEQALFYRALLAAAAGGTDLSSQLSELAAQVEQALRTPIDPKLVQRIASARTIYWAGRNDGVAEELTLKTNEITRKPADFLEGTYAVHGIEEVMNDDEILIWVDPYEGSESKFQEVLVEGVGLPVIAISSRSTRFPTIQIPDAGVLSGYVQMAAGWNILVEVGLQLGINIDKPERARKVGNEFVE
jgi:glucosamine--fructose-6-phosphate aminotransferase (isomerizing)